MPNTTIRPSYPTTVVQTATGETVIQPTPFAVTTIDGGVGPQGPPGPAGPIGPTGGSTVAKVAAQTLSGHRIVRTVDATQVDYCDADTLAHRDTLLGMTTGAAISGAAVNVQAAGEIDEPSWTWTPGQPVFCGPNGTLTQTYSAAWEFARIVGWAQSATRIWFSLREPITLTA